MKVETVGHKIFRSNGALFAETNDSARGRQDAQTIANRVNCHDELVAALEALFEHCAMTHNRWGDGCNQKEAGAAISAGRAALERAKQ